MTIEVTDEMLAIAFECEICDARAELTIAQHKGSTFIQWRYLPNTAKPVPM
jgi:hypothetical protein